MRQVTSLRSDAERADRPWTRCLAGWVIAAGVALSYQAFFLKTFDHWWMDDDPRNFAAAHAVANPLSFFTDHAIAKNFSVTDTVNPMLGLSMWLDTKLVYRSIRFAQLHNVLILTITLGLLFLVVRRCGLSPLGASNVALIWLFLPATGVVSEWPAARHHLEGLTWSLAALLVAQKLAGRDWHQSARNVTLLVLFVACAAFSKETYALTITFGLALYLWEHRRRVAAICCGTVFLVYFAYRWWLVGLSAGGSHYAAIPDIVAFARFLGRLPYIVTGNSGGYVLVAFAICAAVILILRGQIRMKPVLYTLAVIVVGMIVVCRGALPLSEHWLDPATWYRIVVLPATGLLIGAAYLISNRAIPYLRYIASAVALPVAVAGGLHTQARWHAVAERYETEGKFYLDHPDLLIYSEVPAGWYLEGIQQLYDVPVRHHVVAGYEQIQLAQQLAGRHEIWRYADGKFAPDQELFRKLKGMANENSAGG